MSALEVLRAGPQALVTDRGRPGHAHLGVPPSGALDGPAYELGNRLVGNPGGEAGLELLGGGLRVRARGARVVAVTGAPAPVRVAGRAAASHTAVYLPDGAELEIGRPVGGLRVYLAVAGGVDVEPALGSRSTDLLSGLGPAPVADGDELPLGPGSGTVPETGPVPVSLPVAPVRLRVRFGPRADWFTDAHRALLDPTWTVTPDGNRIGIRLDGPSPERLPDARDRELPSEGMVTGSVQVPPDGPPVVFLADHPTTGGYPVIAVVEPADLPLLAQAPPGTPVRFTATA
ncbi:Allophanate hydrolase 2 subunit 2 [Pseudonocardia sp. Ae168_Ps1]|uniref:5-oxoprolinase subunit C family protein n=1 Tax=unclassified Pseudonocardia TaxID=2619320 RepID=UPI00094AC7E8|nr:MULTISPECIES: biotin-dependent carboxyltransferase family protein [unclassified Pseudonocardia]OLL75324.1 Allophanate hydrolase 2 subunit 2 [Pseudonocardia sp. Ae150A_Ps1]OLL81319.1 Allophanate hydrolase 2 subunit 2 [Pseudonocardia sp. Ae168_Ps1]OLL84568.1 Allophanate hydrolase 2 subunit 2 [Pseudonocardia sp. Ae263_Ps1]OLL95413.1 Allophanate hydrolase 2 subunit 2 [Pseudonocardia sp. Ae356_Ps1]